MCILPGWTMACGSVDFAFNQGQTLAERFRLART